MDFVVVGFGIGALAVLIGLTLHDFGPTWRRLRPNLPYPPREVARRIAWGRGCRAAGRVLALAGVTLSLITLVALVTQLSDRAGAVTIMIALTLTLAGLLTWAAFYAHRFHPRPLPRRPGRTAATNSPAPLTDEAVGSSSDSHVDHDPLLDLIGPLRPVSGSDNPPLTNPADPQPLDLAAPSSDAAHHLLNTPSDEPDMMSGDAASRPMGEPVATANTPHDDQPNEPRPIRETPGAIQPPAEPPGVVAADEDEPSPRHETPPDEQDTPRAASVTTPSSEDAPSLTPAGKAH